MRILHISDIHLKEPKGIEVEGILKRFYGIIAANARESSFDQIVITGDIRNSVSSISVDGAIDVINSIAKSANVTDKHQVHFVPGNHDLDRYDNDKINEIRKNYDILNGTFYDPKIDLPIMLRRLNTFFWNLCEKYYGEIDPWSGRSNNPHYLTQYGKHALIFINSSLCCINRAHDGNLILGTAYIKELVDAAVERKASGLMFFAHHPIQNLDNLEETALDTLLSRYPDMIFYWMCGDAHGSRQSPREYVRLYQVGSLTKRERSIPDFAIYDVNCDIIDRKVFRYIEHLNNPTKRGNPTGGWKRVYIDSKAPGLNYDETLE